MGTRPRDPGSDGGQLSRPSPFIYTRPWLVIQNDAGEWLAPPGVWTINPDRRFNLAEFSGRELAEKLATRYGGRVVTMTEKEPTK